MTRIESQPENRLCYATRRSSIILLGHLVVLGWLKTRLWPHVRGTMFEWSNDNTSQYSAALAFFTAFSFFPLILVLLSGLGFVLRYSPFGESNAQQILIDTLNKKASPELADEVNKILTAVADQLASNATVGGPTGFIMLLLGAVGIFANMEVAFYRIWKEYLPPVKPGWWPLIRRLIFGRIKAFFVVLGLGIFVVTTFIAGVVLSTITTEINSLSENDYLKLIDTVPLVSEIPFSSWSISAMQFGASIALNMLLFLYLYRLFCPGRIGWNLCIQGSFVASLLWELGRIALTWYLTRGTNSAYGVIGSFIAMMTWFFYAWNVVFLGAEWAEVGYRIRFGAAAVPPLVKLHLNRQVEPETQPSDPDRPLDKLVNPLPVIGVVQNAAPEDGEKQKRGPDNEAAP